MELIVRLGEREERVVVERTSDDYRVVVGARAYLVSALASGSLTRSLLVEGCQFEVTVDRLAAGRYRVAHGDGAELVEVLDPLSHLAEKSHRGEAAGVQRIDAYMPGRVVALEVAEGQEVAAGQGLLVLEAMKMQNEIQAERAGVVRRVYVQVGQAVEGGDPLLEIE